MVTHSHTIQYCVCVCMLIAYSYTTPLLLYKMWRVIIFLITEHHCISLQSVYTNAYLTSYHLSTLDYSLYSMYGSLSLAIYYVE